MTLTGFTSYGLPPASELVAPSPAQPQRFAWIGAVIGAVQGGAEALQQTTADIAQQQVDAAAQAQAARDERDAAKARNKTITTLLITGGILIVAIVLGITYAKRRKG